MLPKYVALGSDTKSHGYAHNALREIKDASKFEYQLASGHTAVISCEPVIIGGDRAVLPALTGAVFATQEGAAIFDVTFFFGCLHFVCFGQLSSDKHTKKNNTNTENVAERIS